MVVARDIVKKAFAELGPLRKPIRFRYCIEDGDGWGWAVPREKYHLILLSKSLKNAKPKTIQAAVLQDTLIHELAHLYCWTDGPSFRGDHEEMWGIMYARVYCAVTGEH